MEAIRNIKRVVLIGGSCSGKTTLTSELNQRGFTTINEAALIVIIKLTKEMGAAKLAKFRQTNLGKFQQLIAEKQAEMEMCLKSSRGDLVICDGGLLDPVGYCRYFGVTPPRKLLKVVLQHDYYRVFALEPLPNFVPRLKAGRMSDRSSSYELGVSLRQVYCRYGYKPVEVPVMPVNLRADYILEQLTEL